jgi:hypothetical protein
MLEMVADYTREDEYIATLEVAKEVVWTIMFVSKLDNIPSAPSPLEFYCENSGAITNPKEPRS